MSSHQWQFQAKFEQMGQQIAIATIDIFDRGLSLSQLRKWLVSPFSALLSLIKSRLSLRWSLPLIILTTIGTISVLGMTVWLRFEHPLTEFRFSTPDTYGQLLIAQQILARDLPTVNYLPIFPSLAAFLSALSGIHPVQVVHLLGAIVGTLLVLSIGYTTRCLTKNGAAALAASYSLGAYLFTWNLPISSYRTASRVGTAHGIDLNLILVVKYLNLVTYKIDRNTTKSQIELNGSGRSTSREVITGVMSNCSTVHLRKYEIST